ncbi:helix-turn-helix domain-containing protein [Variovorax beijingensis]|uniref:Helix-turn-helix domain-containing protein n=1 Tax=Variovorax beijingensis TaxID=2496117 RepID=A0ABY0A1W1_9BURK|nr:helix-turn-helix domain-containing protein [Variovorax beijingensis]
MARPTRGHPVARELSALDVAAAAGYASIAAFSRAFQRHFGQPPTLHRSGV